MMTLEEAIKHCKDVALSCTNKECALEHFQLLKWLQEYSNMLEKQGEQKLTNKVEPKFKVGDWVVSEVTGSIYQIDCIEIINNHKCGYYLTNSGYINSDEVNRYRLWTIQDAKDGDVLHSPSHRLIWIYKDNEHYYACVNMNYVTENTATNGQIVIPNDTRPATKDEHTILFAKMKEAGYEWDAEKKELKKIL